MAVKHLNLKIICFLMSKKSSVRGYYSTCTTKLTTLRSKHSQSALEYMMTYGWAILIIVIVAAGLYSLGIFSPTNSASTTVTGFSGLGSVNFICTGGGLELSLGDSVGYPINITNINVTINGNRYSSLFPSYRAYNQNYLISPSRTSDFMLPSACPNDTQRFSATISVSYIEPGQTFPGPYLSTGAIAGISTTQYVIYNKSLIVYWPFVQGSGSTIPDFSGNGNTGTFTNSPLWVSGPQCEFGACLNLTDLNPAIVGPTYTVDTNTTSYTYCSWFYITAFNSSDYGNVLVAIDYAWTGLRADTNYAIVPFLDGNGQDLGSVSAGKPHLACAVYPADNTTRTLYIDGSFAGKVNVGKDGTFTGEIISGNDGYTCCSLTHTAPIYLSATMIWNRSLSQQIIQSLYQNTFT